MLILLTKKLLAITLLLFVSLIQAQSNQYLTVDQAFPLTTSVEQDKLIFHWKIEEGYYLYASKFKFKALDDHQLGEPVIPKGVIKQDEFLGKLELLRGDIQVVVPLSDIKGSSLNTKVSVQGCADDGFCYPPHHQEVKIELPEILLAANNGVLESAFSSAVEQEVPSALNSLSVLTQSLSAEDDDGILDPKDAYKFKAQLSDDEKSIRISLKIADGTYLYQDKFKFEVVDSTQVTLGEYQLPKPKIKQNALRIDGTIGELAVYVKAMEMNIPIQRLTTEAGSFTLKSQYQGCADLGVCYPPQRQVNQFQLALTTTDQLTSPSLLDSSNRAAVALAPDPQLLNEHDQISSTLKSGNIWLVVGTFFIFGLLLSLTPCVFPMIPILSGIIAGQGDNITIKRSFTLSLIYVLSMAVAFTAAGILAAKFGQNLTVLFQQTWIIITFSGVFVLLALSMFGFYEIQLPSALQSKLNEMSNKQEGGSYIGVAIMGLLSALIVGPCVAPPLAAALIYISQTGDAQLGGIALFFLAMGMGAPLLLIGASAGSLLPRAGGWMDTVKAIFGVGMLAVAIVLLEKILPASVSMLLWAILLIVSAIYMGALKQLPASSSGWMSLWKGLGVVLLIYGSLMLVGVSIGGNDTVQPLRGLSFTGGGNGDTMQAQHLQFERIKTVADLQNRVAQAAKEGKPVMLDFYADWCVSCKEMERYTFSDSTVIRSLADFVLLQADVTADDEQDKALLQGHFGMPGPPSIMFYDKQGNELKHLGVVGFKNAEEFSSIINKVNK